MPRLPLLLALLPVLAAAAPSPAAVRLIQGERRVLPLPSPSSTLKTDCKRNAAVVLANAVER